MLPEVLILIPKILTKPLKKSLYELKKKELAKELTKS